MEIVFGVLQESVLGTLLSKFFLADLFLIVNSMDIAKYANDNTPYVTANDIYGNADKCHLLVSSNEKVTITIGSY